MQEMCDVPGCKFVADYNAVVKGTEEDRTLCGIHWVAWSVKNAHRINFTTITKLWEK